MEDRIPPITTVANGRCTSAPVPVASAMGMNPNDATNAVINTGPVQIAIDAFDGDSGVSGGCQRFEVLASGGDQGALSIQDFKEAELAHLEPTRGVINRVLCGRQNHRIERLYVSRSSGPLIKGSLGLSAQPELHGITQITGLICAP